MDVISLMDCDNNHHSNPVISENHSSMVGMYVAKEMKGIQPRLCQEPGKAPGTLAGR